MRNTWSTAKSHPHTSGLHIFIISISSRRQPPRPIAVKLPPISTSRGEQGKAVLPSHYLPFVPTYSFLSSIKNLYLSLFSAVHCLSENLRRSVQNAHRGGSCKKSKGGALQMVHSFLVVISSCELCELFALRRIQ